MLRPHFKQLVIKYTPANQPETGEPLSGAVLGEKQGPQRPPLLLLLLLLLRRRRRRLLPVSHTEGDGRGATAEMLMSKNS